MASANQVSQLFVALYNRAIDGGTAQTYAGRAYNQGLISDILGLAPNMRTMTNQEFVELVYKNALGKDNNSDKAGIDYWVEQATNNNWRREELTDNLLKSINAWADQNVNTSGMTSDQITLASNGATVFKTKVAISEKAATTIGGNADVYSLTFGSGLEDVTIGNYNTTQENNNKILQGIAARNPLAQSGGNTLTLDANGQTTFLPTDPNPPASGASKYVASTKFDDVIIGTVTAATDVDNPSSFTSETKIDAGEGYDTLKLSMSADFIRDAALGGSVTGIEKIELTNTTVNDNVTFNASGIRDVYTYVLNGSNGINLTNIAYNEYLLIEMNNVKSTGNTTNSSGANTVTNGGVTQITFDTTPTGGRLDLNFNNVGYDSTDNKISNHDILFGIGSGTAINPGASADDFANQAAGIGMLNIALSGSNYVDIVNNGVNRITVGGNGSLTTNLSQGVTYFNGANATGKLNVTALAPKDIGENGTNIFEYFATGSADDTVNIAVERLGQNATIDLGGGSDTLVLSGQVDHEARKQFYNLNTVENLVFGALTGDALLIDLGTTTTTTTETITSGSGSKTTEEIITNTTVTADRSANLQTITFEDGASVQLTSLGKKDLHVTYNGATDTQKVLVDTEGTVNLVLQGSDGGAAGTGKVGAGFVNLSNAKTVNLDLTGQGFEGFLSAGNATTLNINNLTGDKKLKLKANTLTEKNDLSSVETININTEAQDINNVASGSGFVRSVDLSTADLASLKTATLKGTGGIQFGELANKAGITIDGTNYSGRLETGNIYAGPGPLTITTKGAITTGNLTGNNITIDLSKNITTTDGLYNNNIGTIYVERQDAQNTNGTLVYSTGISGTSYSDGTTSNDTQNIVVNTNSANLTLNGAGGVDKFNVEASSFTKSLTISGNLGTVPDREEAGNNYDTVRIDLSKTSGVVLDISNLLVSNPNNEGIVITSSKGQDNITLVAGANHDVVEFSAGGGATGTPEVYSVDLGNLRLGQNQSFTIDGLTITNISTAGMVLNAYSIADAISKYITGNGTITAGKLANDATTGTTTQNASALVKVTGTFESLVGEWSGATVSNSQTSGGTTTNLTGFTITTSGSGNANDLNFTFGGNAGAANPNALTANVVVGREKGYAEITGKNGTTTITDGQITLQKVASGGTAFVAFNIDGEAHQVKIVNESGSASATGLAKAIVQILNGSAPSEIPANTSFYFDGSTTAITKTSTADTLKAEIDLTGKLGNFLVANGTADGKIKFGIADIFATAQGTFTFDTIAFDTSNLTVTMTALPILSADTKGSIVVDFGNGLLAGQSYTFNGKTVIATRDLSGEEVADAFTYSSTETLDGAVITSNFDTTKINEGSGAQLITDGSKLVINDTSAFDSSTHLQAGILDGAENFVTGTGALAVNTSKVTGSTTTQGRGSGEVTIADSYVVFSVANLGSAGTGSAGGTVANIKAVTSALDSITNFDLANDKLSLNKYVDGGTPAKYISTDVVSISGAGTDTKIVIDAAGSTFSVVGAGVGVIDFSVNAASGASTTPEITLDQKLYAVLHTAIGNNAADQVAGFEHAGDFYIVATGGASGSTTDDLVVKLNGVTGVTDITTLLA